MKIFQIVMFFIVMFFIVMFFIVIVFLFDCIEPTGKTFDNYEYILLSAMCVRLYRTYGTKINCFT